MIIVDMYDDMPSVRRALGQVNPCLQAEPASRLHITEEGDCEAATTGRPWAPHLFAASVAASVHPEKTLIESSDFPIIFVRRGDVGHRITIVPEGRICNLINYAAGQEARQSAARASLRERLTPRPTWGETFTARGIAMGWLSRMLGGGKEEIESPFRTYTVGIVGESHKNPDGSSRQAEIRRCREGERVQLLAEPHNAYDPLAVAVISQRGTCIGYISRDHNEWITQKLADGGIASACIDMIVGGEPGKPSRGVLLELKMMEEGRAFCKYRWRKYDELWNATRGLPLVTDMSIIDL